MMKISKVLKNCLCIMALGNFSSCLHASTLQAFKSDGCSAFPDGTLEQNSLWLTCCQAHDYDYWKGGTYQERKNSDANLKICVEKTGEPEIALLMLAGVRVGGSPFFPTSFRWGYGWSYPKFYAPLSPPELEQIKHTNKLQQDVLPNLTVPPASTKKPDREK